MFNFLIGVGLLFAAGVFTIFLNDKRKGIIFIGITFIAQFFTLPSSINVLLTGKVLQANFIFSNPIGNSAIILDPLSAFFSVFISFGSLLGAIYSLGYMKHYDSKKYSLSSFYFFFGMLASTMMLVVVVQNGLLFLIVWELMSLSSFFLVAFENDKIEVRKAGIYYLIAMHIGASFLIAAFAWLSFLSGSFEFNSFSKILSENNIVSITLFIFFFIGFGTKAGFVPFHSWLPKAHPAAPTGVSAVMSGIMIKTGIYGILRIILLMKVPDVTLSFGVLIISLITGIYGVINAIAQHDLKKLLAYHSIENIGIIGMGIGVGMLGISYHHPFIAILGFLGGILHIFNHFTFKSLLFYGAGIAYIKTGTRNLEKMGGLIKSIPVTALLFLLGSMAISGLPMFSGFISELSIYLGMFKSFAINNLAINISVLVGISGLAFIGIMAVLCFTKVVGICFLGNPRSSYHVDQSEKSFSFYIPQILLALFIVAIGLFPLTILPLLLPLVKQFIHTDITVEIAQVSSIYKSVTNALLLFGGLAAILLTIRYFLLRNRTVVKFKTWDCGYQASSSKLQYTASSYALPFLQLVSGIISRKTYIKSNKALFPSSIELETHSTDLAEKFIIHPMLIAIKRFLEIFTWIQSGRMQQYILYGIIFLVIILSWIIWVS